MNAELGEERPDKDSQRIGSCMIAAWSVCAQWMGSCSLCASIRKGPWPPRGETALSLTCDSPSAELSRMAFNGCGSRSSFLLRALKTAQINAERPCCAERDFSKAEFTSEAPFWTHSR